MKKTGKMFGWLAAFLLMTALLLPQASLTAAAERGELTDLETTQDIVIIVTYDKEEPDVAFMTPDGTVLRADTDFFQVVRESGKIFFYIEQAEAGVWYIDYDKKTNVEMGVSILAWHRDIAIDSFRFEETDTDELTAYYTVTYDADNGFDVYFYAVAVAADGTEGEAVQLGNGWSYGGEDDYRLSTEDLPDGTYKLAMEAVGTDASEVEMSAYQVSEQTFTVSGHTTTGEAADLSVLYDTAAGTVWVTFSPAELRADTVQAYAAAGSQVLFDETYDDYPWEDSFLMDPEAGDAVLTLQAKDWDGGYKTYTRTIKAALPVTLAITEGVTTAPQAEVTYDVGNASVPAVFSVNGAEQEVILTGAGTAHVEIEPSQTNEITVTVTIDEVAYRIYGRVTVDDIPPLITLFGVEDELRVADSRVAIAGLTDPGAVFTCNGETVKVAEDGSFLYESEVEEGRTELRFEAADGAGNTTARTVTVIRGQDDGGSRSGAKADDSGKGGDTGEDAGPSSGTSRMPMALFIALGASMVAGIVISVAGLISQAVQRKKGCKVTPVLTILTAFLGCLIAGCLVAFVFTLRAYHAAGDDLSGSGLVAALRSMTTSQLADEIRSREDIRTAAYRWLAAGGILTGVLAVTQVVGQLILAARRKLKK